jgi:dTDP-4-dehydrorhamnose reductase
LTGQESNVRVFVFGAEGQIARSLREAATHHRGIVIGHSGRADVDILRADQVEKALDEFAPGIVVNPAAYTAVDKAEAEPELAFAINRDGAAIVAAAAKRRGVPLIHLSTDYVFDGGKDGSYVESDPVDPQGVYGQSKLAGEHAVAQANDCHVILRTSWIYAAFGNNFVRTMIRLSGGGKPLRVVDDQTGCPTYAPDVADAILIIARRIETAGWSSRFAGVTHLAGPDAVTWCQFARMIVDAAPKIGGERAMVEAISTADYPTAARRPRNSRLCCDRLAEIFDVRLPPLQLSLANCLRRLFETPT